MIVFNSGRKINFVDENDVFVGYDTAHYCCENAGWFICEEIKKDDIETENKYEVGENKYSSALKGYTFDSSFVLKPNTEPGCYMVVFRLTKEGESSKYLHIFNCQNGYYSHGVYTNGIDGVDERFSL